MPVARKRLRIHPGADVFHAVADPTRRRLLDRLAHGDFHVNALAKPFRMSRPAISQHLGILRDAGLVAVRRQGRARIYRLEARRLRDVYDWVAHYERFWKQKLQALGDYLNQQKAARKDSPDEPGPQPENNE